MKSEIAIIYEEKREDFDEEDEHFVLIFFVTYHMSLGKRSFWHPYFEIAADSDLPMGWSEKDLMFLEDETLKMSVAEQREECEEEYEVALEIAGDYPNLIDIEKFTYENYRKAYCLVMTRAFGWSLPYMMLVPVADNLNHHCVDNQFELFNSELETRKKKDQNTNFDNFEK